MITAKQEAFCQALLAGRSQSDAYRDAYNTKPGSTAGAIAVSASKLMADPNITIRVAELREVVAEKAQWSRHQSVQALKDIATSDCFSPAARIAAVRELNMMFGFNTPARPEADMRLLPIHHLKPLMDDDWL
jgi:hypothetical protein